MSNHKVTECYKSTDNNQYTSVLCHNYNIVLSPNPIQQLTFSRNRYRTTSAFPVDAAMCSGVIEKWSASENRNMDVSQRYCMATLIIRQQWKGGSAQWAMISVHIQFQQCNSACPELTAITLTQNMTQATDQMRSDSSDYSHAPSTHCMMQWGFPPLIYNTQVCAMLQHFVHDSDVTMSVTEKEKKL